MSYPFGRVVVSLVLAPWLALSATMAPEHVHESDADHPHAIAHRHVELHELAAHDHDGAEIDHVDGHIVWLGSVGACQSAYQLPAPDAVLSHRFEFVPALADWVVAAINDAAPPHGPPRFPQSLRAPPISAR